MDAIEKRYGVLIDYVDAPYAAPQDTEAAHYRPGHATLIPKTHSISVSYTPLGQGPRGIRYLSCNAATLGCAPVETWPELGMTALIQQVLNQFAAQGGQVFLVRKLNMPYGPRWEVFPEEARNHSGVFVYQPDILGANVIFPSKAAGAGGQTQTPNDLLRSIYLQLESKWGSEFRIAGIPAGIPGETNATLEGESVTAWEALARFMGPGWVLRFYYAPDNGMYYPNMARLPYRQPPRPPTPTPAPARLASPRPQPPGYWQFMARTPEGMSQMQGALVQAGFLHSAPSGKWDKGTIAAVRQFQVASGIPSTGRLDTLTVLKLEAYLPKYRPRIPPKPAVDPILFGWLDSTQRGRIEIQEALTKAGFYSGPTTGRFDVQTRAALKAFQKANGIPPADGIFDFNTAQKLAPFLPKPKE
ncbi:MAG: peptidoglycan-binding protein [Acidobacteriota bacterium]|nr:peptidoglycan-binding protein [Acidobacteriota bacterium]